MPSRSRADCYRLLELPPEASAADVDAAYLRLAHQYLRAGRKAELTDLKEARASLRDALQQEASDRARAQEQAIAQAASPTESLRQDLADLGWEAQVGIKGRSLYVALKADQVPPSAIASAKVYALVADRVATTPELARLQRLQIYALRAPKQPRWKRQFVMPQPLESAADNDLFSFQNRWSNLLFFPLLLLLGMGLKAWSVSSFLLRGIAIWLHEFGHATVAWLSGRRAIPLPLGWTNYELERSLFVYIGLLVLFGLLFWSGRREGRRWPQVLAIALALLQAWMTWGLSIDTFEMLNAFGGIGGEFCLSTLLMVSFYFPLPDYWRWDFWRYPAIVGAAFTFWGSYWQWRDVQRGLTDLPWGSLWGGPDHGDLNTLRDTFGWSGDELSAVYNHLASLCLVAILATYVGRALWPNRHFLWVQVQRGLARFA